MRIQLSQKRLTLGVVFFGWALALLGCRTASARPLRPGPVQDDLQAGIKAFEQGQFAQAEAALRNAAGPEAQAYLAGSLAKQRKYAEAEAPAKAALEANPTHPVAVAALGESLVGQKKHDEAVARLSAAIKAKPDLAYAFFWRGQAYYAKKQQDRMIEDFETFLKLAPKAPEANTIQQLLAGIR
jgi:tetratricopeptide (TPR) repeat protein